MKRREFLKRITAAAGAVALGGCGSPARRLGRKINNRPNVVIILTDDQGYADVGCYGAQGLTTPNLDKMAAEGTRFTDFHVAAPVCTPSRAALMTGCYPQRVSLPHVLGPDARTGISGEEVTIAEILKSSGYATACFGKWHLGHHPRFLPCRHGFDEYFGLPYSNDMQPTNLIDGEQIVDTSPDQTQLTLLYTSRAVSFIERNKHNPFFIYLPHSMPHVPLHVSARFMGKSSQGLYGDVIMEIDWSVGEILSALRRLGLDEKTLIIFTSDNGPWLSYGDHAGSAGPLREGKTTTFEGGMRIPCYNAYARHNRPRLRLHRACHCDGFPPHCCQDGGCAASAQQDRRARHRYVIDRRAQREESLYGILSLQWLATGCGPQREVEAASSSHI